MTTGTPRTDLRALAEAATPETHGNWRYRRSPAGPPYGYVEWGKRDEGYGTATLSETMARYIAAVDPQTVLALLDRAERAEAVVAAVLLDELANHEHPLRGVPREYEPGHLVCDECGYDTARDLVISAAEQATEPSEIANGGLG